MPSIPKELLNTVFYLYASKEDALAGKDFGGAGFFVGVRSETNAAVHYIYACTNWHVAVKDGYSVMRVNTKSGGTDVVDLDPADWHYLPQGGDLAVSSPSLDFDRVTHDVNFIGLETLGDDIGLAIKREDDASGYIGIGEDVVMIGRFVDHDGGQRNQPAVRFGNVSIRPTPIKWMNSGPDVRYYCLDMHSRTGFSGSPVLAYRTPGSDLASAFKAGGDTNLLLIPTVVKLLGIHCGQFPEEMEMEVEGKKGIVTGVSGMTIALPAWHLLDFLNAPLFKDKRDANDQQWKGKAPCPE